MTWGCSSGWPSDDYGPPDSLLSVYGPTPDFCTLLDGLFLAVRTRKLREAGIYFDTRFRFHMYDIDFCRQATEAGILMGTWPIHVTHGSGGNFALAAARALLDTDLDAEAIARKAMAIAASICVYTNNEVIIESLKSKT